MVRLRLADSAVADLPADAGQRLAEAAAPPARWHANLPDFPAWQRLGAEGEPLSATLAIEILALLLQRWAFWPSASPTARKRQEPEDRTIVFETRQPEAGLIAGEMAVRLCDALRRGRLDRERWFRRGRNLPAQDRSASRPTSTRWR